MSVRGDFSNQDKPYQSQVSKSNRESFHSVKGSTMSGPDKTTENVSRNIFQRIADFFSQMLRTNLIFKGSKINTKAQAERQSEYDGSSPRSSFASTPRQSNYTRASSVSNSSRSSGAPSDTYTLSDSGSSSRRSSNMSLDSRTSESRASSASSRSSYEGGTRDSNMSIDKRSSRSSSSSEGSVVDVRGYLGLPKELKYTQLKPESELKYTQLKPEPKYTELPPEKPLPPNERPSPPLPNQYVNLPLKGKDGYGKLPTSRLTEAQAEIRDKINDLGDDEALAGVNKTPARDGPLKPATFNPEIAEEDLEISNDYRGEDMSPQDVNMEDFVANETILEQARDEVEQFNMQQEALDIQNFLKSNGLFNN